MVPDGLDLVEGQHRLALGQAVVLARVGQALAAEPGERREKPALALQIDHLGQGNQRILKARRDHPEIVGILGLEPQVILHLTPRTATRMGLL